MNLSHKFLQSDARWRALRSPTGAVGDAEPPEVSTEHSGTHVRWVGAVFALVAAVVILWIFYGVIRGSILQGETRRATAAQRELAAWRCARQGGRAARDACIAQMDPVSFDQTAPSR